MCSRDTQRHLIGGDDWAKFKRDFNVCQGKKLVFDMSGRMPHAYVCYVGGGLVAVHGGPAQDMAGDDVGRRGVTNAGHGVEAAPDIIYTRGVVLSDGEGQMLGLVITIEDGYIGPHFVHRLTPTNITSKSMKIPKKIVQPLNLAPEGVVVLCMGVGEVMQLGYHMDRDGRMVFDKDWCVF